MNADQQYSLRMAIENEDISFLSEWLDKKYSINKRLSSGRSVLAEAVIDRKYKVVDFFLKSGGEINSRHKKGHWGGLVWTDSLLS
jgi:hypothetical protein